jgi:site-specific recombinase XerD
MSKVNIKNEQIKRKYFKYLRDAEGFSESTVDSFNKAILVFEEFTKYEDFRKKFNPDKMSDFKEWIKKREFKDKVISLVTFHAYIRNLRKFFIWLREQPGYKSNIRLDVIGYLKLKNNEERMATQKVPIAYPDLEYVIKLTGSIVCQTEINKRDRALIAFTFLTGMRDSAIVSLPLKCVDLNKLEIHQNPMQGVKTKFSKYIESIIFKFDEKLVQYVKDWVKLLDDKGFKGNNPLFPRSKTNQDMINISFDKAVEVEPAFWSSAGTMRGIFKKRTEYAGLKYYPPHSYRHSTKALAFKRCKNGEELHAVSQNFGHENLATTFGSYGNYPSNRLSEILKNIDFSGKSSVIDTDTIKKMKELISELEMASPTPISDRILHI